MTAYRLTLELASHFACIALGHVAREYPNKLQHVLEDPDDALTPHELHPIFYGSFDWHSCVHGYWLLATILRLYPQMPEAAAIRSCFAAAFTPDNVAGERRFLARPSSRGFERPYGWAWLLMLQAELLRHDDPAGRQIAATMQPLADDFAARFKTFLPIATYPVRTGTHFNTAFALRLAADYAEAVSDVELSNLLTTTARRWYQADHDAQAWEPSGDDFLSSTLIEAEAMRRLLPPSEFQPWFAAFLPRLADRQPRTLFEPATVSDRSDGKIAHLDGLNLSRAWCWRALASSFDIDNMLSKLLCFSADQHLEASLPEIAGDYMSEHWLASFALLALQDSRYHVTAMDRSTNI